MIVSVVTKIAATNPNIPTLSGNGLTWTQVATLLQTGDQRVRTTVFRALSLSAITPGAVTADFSGQSQDDGVINISEFGNVVTTGTNGADAIIQTATSIVGGVNPSVSLSAFARQTNATFGVIGSLSLGTSYSSNIAQLFTRVASETVVQGHFQDTPNTTINWTQSPSTYPTAVLAMEINGSISGGGSILALL